MQYILDSVIFIFNSVTEISENLVTNISCKTDTAFFLEYTQQRRWLYKNALISLK